jgi:hypothetical protein
MPITVRKTTSRCVALAALLQAPMLLAACGEDDVLETPGADTSDDTSTDVGEALDSAGDSDSGPAVDVGSDAADVGVDSFADTEDAVEADVFVPTEPEWAGVEFTPPEPPVPRLTRDQLRNSLQAVFGADVVVPPFSEPDVEETFFYTVGSGLATVSSRGVENLEQIAYAVAGQAVEETRRELMPCEPASADDTACFETIAQTFGTPLWRRPLTEEQIARFAAVGVEAATTLNDPWAGVEFLLAGLIQAPNFLFRREIGVVDEETGWRQYDDFDMAARLSFFLWDTTPDAELLDAASTGALSTDEGLATQVDRLLSDERARAGVRSLFSQLLRLNVLSDLNKDPTQFEHFDARLGPAAREETLRLIDALVFDERADFRDFVTSNRTFVDRQLAAIYDIPAPVREGFAEAYLPAELGRRGFLGQVSFLAVNAHPVASSATLRGKFIRERLLCQTMPSPPANANTAIPEPSADARTLRERVAVHLENPDCSGCHLLMDPIGLTFENFDGVGRWRDTDNDAPIDPSGNLDGASFANAWEMPTALRDNPEFGACIARMSYRYATGMHEGLDQRGAVNTFGDFFAATGYDVYALLRAIALSPAFRYAGPISVEE